MDLGALYRLEEVTGLEVLDPEVINKATRSATVLRALLWSCLVHEDPDLTLEQTGELVHVGNMQQLGEAVGQLLFGSLAEPEPESESGDADAGEAAAPDATG